MAQRSGVQKGCVMREEILAATARCAIRLYEPATVEVSGYREEESQIPVRRLKRPNVQESGIRFQRCGGGRRVIRRQNGRSY